MSRGTVAVIGSGVAGLTSAYLLSRRYDVTLFEADDRLGGHAHTHELSNGLMVDSGFLVHNRTTYPNLVRLFDELGVQAQDCEMSMSVRCEGCGLEYAGARGLAALCARPRVLARGQYQLMLAEIMRFYRQANRLLDTACRGHEGSPGAGELTLGEFLRAGRYSAYLRRHFVFPVVSAVWSASGELAAQYPARYLFVFLRNHGMLTLGNSPTWRTLVGGSHNYVRRIADRIACVRLRSRIDTVRRTPAGVELLDRRGERHSADRVVIATHPDQALRMLARPTAAERDVLGAFRYSSNEVWLHQDPTVLPRAARARASWNLLKASCEDGSAPVLVSYDVNRLMRLAQPDPYLVTLNGAGRLQPARVLARMVYEHPIYTPASAAAQRRLPGLNDGVVAFAGAYHGWGFHEDGCAAGTRAAESFGVCW